MKLSHLLLNAAIALLVWAILIGSTQAGTFVCNSNCLSKAASVVAMGSHLPQIISMTKRAKTTKAKRTK